MMISIILGGWFSLPRLGRDAFAALMKQGVIYEKEMGFRFDAATDVRSAIKTLELATGEEVELVLRCYVCGQQACEGCPYGTVCDRMAVSSMCLCGTHASTEDALVAYSKTFRVNMPTT